MIALAAVIIGAIIFMGIAARLVFLLRRFTCASVDDALALAQEYNKKGIRVLMNYAAESVRDDIDAATVWVTYEQLIQRLVQNGIDGDLSIKLSSLIHPLRQESDRKLFVLRLRELLEHAGQRTVWIDEEQARDARYLMDGFEAAESEFKNLGLVVRAYRANALERADHYAQWYHRGLGLRIRVCRGAYPKDEELSRDGTEVMFCSVYRHLRMNGVPVVAATHTLTTRVLAMRDFPLPAIHMLHGRREVREILEPLVRERRVSEAAVYVIFGPLSGRIRYGIRRILERPSLLLRG